MKRMFGRFRGNVQCDFLENAKDGGGAPEPPGRLFLDGDDDAAEEDALAGEEDEEGREGGQNEGGLDDAGAGALLELVEPDHQGPHFRGLADEEGVHEVGVGQGEGLEGDDGEDGGGEAHRYVPEEGPFAGAVELGGFVEVAGEGVEEAFQKEDGIAAGGAGEEEGGEGVQEAELAEEEEDGYLGDHVGEGHGEHEEEENLGAAAEVAAGEGVGRQWVDEEGDEDGEDAVDDGVEDAAAVEEEVVEDGAVVA